MDIGSKDLISRLPDVLLCHVLSFLTTKDAALTSVLAKRWRYLLAFVPNLDLDNTIYDRPKMGKRRKLQMRRSFSVFVDRVLALQGNAPLNKFSLKGEFGSDLSHINGWILSVLERGVVELDLFIDSEDKYQLPPKVLMNNALVSLKLEGTIIDVGDVFLPKLKTLHFNDVLFQDVSGVAFAKMISSCGALEELVWIDGTWYFWKSFSVSNPTLKRIRIASKKNTFEHPKSASFDFQNLLFEHTKSVSFDTPNLLYLDLTDTVATKYPKANFDSLVEARLGIRMTLDMTFHEIDLVNLDYEGFEGGSGADLLMGICNVKTLYLSSEALEVLNFCCKEAIPVFNNLTHLTIETEQQVFWVCLPKLLENSRNLETLVFEGLHYRDTNQCFKEGYSFNDTNECYSGDLCSCKPWCGTPVWLSSSLVKILKVLKFGEITDRKDDFDRQRDLIEHFLETMPNLEQVILYYDLITDVDVKSLLIRLQMLKRVASNKCNIQVISDNISYSTTVSSSSSTSAPVFFNTTFPA